MTRLRKRNVLKRAPRKRSFNVDDVSKKKGKTKKVVSNAADVRPKVPSIRPTGTVPGPNRQQGSNDVGGYGGGSYLFSGEQNAELYGDNLWRKLSDVLATTMIIASAVRFSLNLITNVEWDAIENPRCQDRTLARKAAETAKLGLLDADMDQPWQMHVGKQALHAWYGFSLHNWFFRKRSDGLIVFSDLRHRPQSTIKGWDIGEEGEPWAGVVQRTKAGGQYYLERKRLWYTSDQSIADHPVGVGLLRHTVQHASMLGHYEKIERYGFDANLRGIPIGRAPIAEILSMKNHVDGSGNKITAAEALAIATEGIEGFLTDHTRTPEQGLMLDSAVYQSGKPGETNFSGIPKWAVELLQGDDMGLAQIAATIERINREIARVLSFEWAMLGDGDGGSNAMHVDKTSQYGALINAIVNRLAVTARADLIRPLIARNHGAEAAEEACPILVPSKISTDDLTTVTTSIANMKSSGAYIPPDDPVFGWIRKKMGAPAPVEVPPGALGSFGGLPLPPRDPNDPRNPDNMSDEELAEYEADEDGEDIGDNHELDEYEDGANRKPGAPTRKPPQRAQRFANRKRKRLPPRNTR